jgi:DNA polymerase-3 subunit alpha
MNTKRGDKMAFVTLDDRSARVELAVFSEAFQQYRDLLAKERLVVVEGEVSVDDYTGGVKMSAHKIYDINRAREVFAKRLLLLLDHSKAESGRFADSLMQILSPYKQGHCPVYVDYRGRRAQARLKLSEEWAVHPTDELIHRLHEFAGSEQVKVEYS